ncbi:hypothetical protein BC936DRAFT_139620 [Jimgerdemannia flammicorona]|uniref:Dynamin-type G domain-containing protein n=1 Tax=Jimgerdemannia flammicorona TaxID=994334 RepID=A0A433B9K5_9FUNG|nr:hypothetical protein BC936DRAFT_139620 [Jimgerdemannia flammicorona]
MSDFEILSAGPSTPPLSTHLGGGNIYARVAEEYISLLQELQTSSETLNLPKIVICGNQSCGKSSVVEGLTGVPLPRYALYIREYDPVS